MDSNKLTALPDSLGELALLQDLDVGGNQLTSLPDTFGHLAQLQELGLARNRIATLPEGFGQLGVEQQRLREVLHGPFLVIAREADRRAVGEVQGAARLELEGLFDGTYVKGLAVNTDAQHLLRVNVENKVLIGRSARGRGREP